MVCADCTSIKSHCASSVVGFVINLLLMLAAATAASAQGLSFETQSFKPTRGSIIIPSDKVSTEAKEAFQIIDDVLSNVKEPIWYDSSTAALEAQNLNPVIGNANGGVSQSKIYVEINEVSVEGAAWLKLKFKQVWLGASELHISSPNSGRSQTFDAELLKEWDWQSTLFSGDRLRLQLRVPNGDAPVSVDNVVDEVIVGSSLLPEKSYPEQIVNDEQNGLKEEAVCNIDERAFSQEPVVGRMRPAMCSVFILEGGVYGTAGHCFRKNRDLQDVEFNVPDSSSNGIPQESDETDVYHVIKDSIKCSDCVVGKNLKHGMDWAVFRLSRNTETKLEAIEKQGSFLQEETQGWPVDSPTRVARIAGFGWDNDPLPAMYAQQTANGEVSVAQNTSANDVELLHFIDTEAGASGAPIILESDKTGSAQTVIGIHTGGRCDPNRNRPNKGTGTVNEGLLKAIRELRGTNVAKQ